ncbi:PepSY domain-containing protein [Pontibacter sp. BT310]|uniref:PepSY domain-containing protein n=1 Tax=Pontibacter populi TaxID=890055 RepID=A0ABS6X8A1_9BACT|nr:MULTISPECIES: PepSY-associated TM helix domain-containing protein [Pontibacter]MBJ6117377.1 PepSY domain-containing protein [Pontibacter sp. BT310]MBR0569802.1 PepSY domain-containing protein [Microvirga sp. STS03]MBW3364230.1 PepSY domain-containing protein [Pontibacter populi]
MEKSFSWRKLFNDVHLWLGIGSGLVLFIVCLTGTIYTFRSDIEEMLEPEKYTVTVPANGQALSPDALIAKLEQEQQGTVVSLEIPAEKESSYRVSIAPPVTEEPKAKGEGRGGEGPRPTTYFVNPYTGTIAGTTEGPASEFFGTVMKAHRWLLMGDSVGRIIVGIATIIFTFLCLTGLVLWWPKKLKNWKQGFKVKTDANWKRINHDLHNTFGFYAFILLLIMSLTGLCWSFEWYREALGKVMGAEVFKGRKEKPLSSFATADATTLTTEDFIVKANALLPYEGNMRVSLPDNDSTAVVITKSQAGFLALNASDKVQLDQHNGQALKVDIFAEKPLNEQIVSLVKPLHLGDVYGTFSKILYFLACLIATSLPVTGTIIWINKLNKKGKKKLKARTIATV